MTNENVDFPVYRKFKGINVWFKILNEREFIELKQIGSTFMVHSVLAEQYPEIIRIQDMLVCLNDHWEVSSADFFEENYPV